MPHSNDGYADYVVHPRYGQTPRLTGLNPPDDMTRGVYLGCHSRADERIPNTAIVANTDRQPRAMTPVTHYFDLRRRCRDCGRAFIFFAAEQQHWYETLQFFVAANCVRCIECRVAQRGLKQLRKRYEELLAQHVRSAAENLELAEIAMLLIDQGVFGQRAVQRVRALLNAIPEDSKVRGQATFRRVDRQSAAHIQHDS